jgi:hypothetical protein
VRVPESVADAYNAYLASSPHEAATAWDLFRDECHENYLLTNEAAHLITTLGELL